MKCKRWRRMYVYVCMYVCMYIYICIYIRLFYRGEPISDQRGLHHARLFICAHLLLLERVLRATRRRSSAGINSEKSLVTGMHLLSNVNTYVIYTFILY